MAWFLGAVAGQAASSASAALAPGGAASPAVLSAPASLPWWRIALLALIFAVLVGVWVWVNRGRISLRTLLQPAHQQVVIREQRWVNARTLVCLVEVGGERFLLAQGQGSVAWQPLKPDASIPVPAPAAPKL